MTPAERGVILDALRLLELTRRSFKSKHVAAARARLESLVPTAAVLARRPHVASRDCWCHPSVEKP